MAALTFFIAASPSKNRFSPEELESFVMDLLQLQHVFLPATIFVGEARNEPRGEDWDEASAKGTLLQASKYIIPNAPGLMLRLAEQITSSKLTASAQTLWYSGQDEAALIAALRSVPFETKDCCVCFRRLNQSLSNCGWAGAAIYKLTRPFPTDFMDVFDTTASPLINYETASFFTLASWAGGKFPDPVNNPLKPILERYFGSDLDMKQTWL